jgi:hypothetical protein
VGEFYAARIEPGCHAPSAAPAAADPGVYDDFDPLILFDGDWERDDGFAEVYRRTVTYSDTAGALATFAFRGSELVWVFTRAPNRGIAAVTVDGSDAGTFDLYSKDVQWQSRLRFPNLASGPHLIVIRVTGKSRPAAQGHFVDIDSFEVKP